MPSQRKFARILDPQDMDLSRDIMTAYADSAFRPRHLDSDLSVQVA